MTDKASPYTVSRDWLESRLGTTDLSIVDASWYLPAQNRHARAEYEEAHIPGAVFFDQDKIAEPGSDLPHTLPSPEIFARYAGAMGFTADQTIVVYDGPGLFSAARVWWMLRVMGAKNVAVLDGGFDRWKAESRTTTGELKIPTPTVFQTSYDKDTPVFFDEMAKLVEEGDIQILDARAEGRFTAEQPEPRAGMRGGHMPGAINMPFTRLTEDGALKKPEALATVFADAGVDLGKPIVTSCGSGVTAAVINLALVTLGKEDAKLYDGSWAEWGSKSETPIVTGA